MRTNASISRRHIGHDRKECPHGTHVAKWPQGMQASRLSSDKHSTHGLAGDESLVWFFSLVVEVDGFVALLCSWFSVVAFCDVDSIEEVDSFVADCDETVISTSVISVAVEVDWLGIGAVVVVPFCSRATASIDDNKRLLEKCHLRMIHYAYLLVLSLHLLESSSF